MTEPSKKPPKPEPRKKFWRGDSSLDASSLSKAERLKIKKRRLEFEARQKALESWARAGFTAVFPVDEAPPEGDDVVE